MLACGRVADHHLLCLTISIALSSAQYLALVTLACGTACSQLPSVQVCRYLLRVILTTNHYNAICCAYVLVRAIRIRCHIS